METIIVALAEAVVLSGIFAAVYWYFLRKNLLINAKKEAELHAKHIELQAKEEALKARSDMEEEIRLKRQSLDAQEQKLLAREENVEREKKRLEELDGVLAKRESGIVAEESLVQRKRETVEAELERLSRMTKEQAKEAYFAKIEQEYREVGTARGRAIEEQIASEAERKAKTAVLDVIQRSNVDYVTEATVAVVELPSEDMKGRIIGREGRNIRAFEQVTGVDLIIDDTPEAVVISCFDPVRREVARIALMNLMADGRIQPGRIEELYEKAQQEVERMIQESGDRALERAGVAGIPNGVVHTLGKLRFRQSYGQNVLDHSVEVARMAGMLAAELGFDVEVAKRAGLLHDIGKALGSEWEGPHALTGMEYLRQSGEKEPILNAVGAHHNEIDPTSPESHIIIVADSISAARPGARRESLENYIKRLASLEKLANSFEGVERSYAIHAGREVRLLVKPEMIDDLGAVHLATEVAKRIEAEMEYPGHIKVTVIRETRVSEFAK